jgi:hypothetical protein
VFEIDDLNWGKCEKARLLCQHGGVERFRGQSSLILIVLRFVSRIICGFPILIEARPEGIAEHTSF